MALNKEDFMQEYIIHRLRNLDSSKTQFAGSPSALADEAHTVWQRMQDLLNKDVSKMIKEEKPLECVEDKPKIFS